MSIIKRTGLGAFFMSLLSMSSWAVTWPNATTSQSGNLASTGSDGWGRAIPVAEDVDFSGGGTYTVYLDHESIALATNEQTAVAPKVYGTVSLPQFSKNAPIHGTFDIRNGAELLVKNLYFGFNNNNYGLDDVSTDFIVRDGSTLHALGVLALRSGVCSLTVKDGSTLTTDDKFYLHSTSTKSTEIGRIRARFCLKDSSWTAKGDVQIGNPSCPATLDPAPVLSAGLTNSVIALNAYLQVNCTTVTFRDCTVDGEKSDGTVRAANDSNVRVGYAGEIVFDGGTYTNLVLCPGYGSGRSAIRLLGGTMDLSGWSLAPTAGADGLFAIDGETAVVRYMNSANDKIGIGATGTVSLVNGFLQAKGGGFTRVGVGTSSNKKAVGSANVSSGTWILNALHNPGGFYVGENGEGHVRVSGGLLAGNYITVVSTLGNSDFTMTGGRVRLDASYGTKMSESSTVKTTVKNNETGLLKLNSGTAKAVLDGGILEANGILGGASSILSANGGTVRVLPLPVKGTVYDPFISAFGTATVGEQGLTIDTDGYDANVTQAFADAADAVGAGRLVKTGAGTLTLAPTSYAVAQTVVAGGTLTPGVASLATELVLTNGAAFSLAGAATAVTLSALSVPNGRLELDPGDTVTVTGAVDLDNLKLSFTSAPSSATGFLIVHGELSAESQAALRRALYAAEVPEGKHGKFVPTYDADTGKTTVTFEFADNIGELTDVTTWRGTSAGWTVTGNWSGGVPTAAKQAAFTDASTVKTVETAAGAIVGAVTFGTDGYTIGGAAPLELAGEPDAAHIDATAGTNEISAPLVLDSLTRLSLASGTELRLSGAVKAGGLEKSGKGRLVLSNPQLDCPWGLTLLGGTTVATCHGALGTLNGVDPAVVVSNDTLEVKSPTGAEIAFDQSVSLRGADDTRAIVLKNETPAVFENLTRESGAIIKRGREKLTLAVRDGATLIAGKGVLQGTLDKDVEADWALNFDADGTSPTSGYGALTIAEGELCIKPAVEGETPSVTAKGAILVGNRLYEGGSNPTLTVDHVEFDASYSWRTEVGLYINKDDCVMREPTLRIVNGATYLSDVMEIGRFCNLADMSVRPTLIVEDSTLQAWSFRPSHGTAGTGNASIVQGKDATFRIGSEIMVSGTVNGDFDNCILRSYDDGTYFKLTNKSYTPRGYLRFRNGSELWLNSFKLNPIKDQFKLVFDNATWKFGTGDFTLSATDTTQFSQTGMFSLEMEGIGLIVAPASGRTLTLDVPVVGEGGFVQAGEGTVAFGAGCYGFTGPLTARSGIVDLAAAGEVTNAVLAGGVGTIRNGSFRNAEVRLTGVGGAVPHFCNAAFAGRSYLSVPGVTGTCKNVRIATYEGTLSLPSTFRVKGLDGYRANLTAKDGEVRADIDRFGLCLIIR